MAERAPSLSSEDGDFAPLVAAGILLAALVVAGARGTKRKPAAERTFPYESQGALFSPAERSFLGVLEQAAGGAYRVYGKVRLADVVKAKTPDRSEWRRAFNAIGSKHVDFVLCDPKDTRIVAVVELDDGSHGREERQERDAFLAQALATANIKLLRFSVKSGYSLEDVRRRLPSG